MESEIRQVLVLELASQDLNQSTQKLVTNKM